VRERLQAVEGDPEEMRAEAIESKRRIVSGVAE
jgi:hypothetical protein